MSAHTYLSISQIIRDIHDVTLCNRERKTPQALQLVNSRSTEQKGSAAEILLSLKLLWMFKDGNHFSFIPFVLVFKSFVHQNIEGLSARSWQIAARLIAY